MASMIERICKTCKTTFMARTADVKRGWGLYCSKSCKAITQEKQTGQYRRYKESIDDLDWDAGGKNGNIYVEKDD